MIIFKAICDHYVYALRSTIDTCYNCQDNKNTIDYVCFNLYSHRYLSNVNVYNDLVFDETWGFYGY